MNDKYLIERLNTLRIHRVSIWNAFLLSTGATAGLLLRAWQVKFSTPEIIFIFSGFALIVVLILIIHSFNKKIDTILNELKKLK